MDTTEILTKLNAPSAEERLENLRRLIASEDAPPAVKPEYANNHIHTTYSFSPYSPSAAVYFARAAGLPTAGIMDHDSIAGGAEFRAAGNIAGVGVTCGFECRVCLAGSVFANRKLNSPDQAGVAYMAVHSVRERYFKRVGEVFEPLRERRNERNRAMTRRAAAATGVALDFDDDVLPLSMYNDGGSVTERHILCALALKLGAPGDGGRFWLYDMLGSMKKTLLPEIYIPAADELPVLGELVSLAAEIDAVLCYAYLGDVGVSVTGDKATAVYEDGFLDELLLFMKNSGVHGVTFMPSRNSREQLVRLMSLCGNHGLTQISGEDINSPRQSFICKQLAEPEFKHLVDAAWKMVNRETEG